MQVRKYFAENYQIKSPAPYPSCAHRHSPPFGGVGGGCRGLGRLFLNYTYLSVKQIVAMMFAELVTPVPRKTIVFRIKLLTFANRKKQPHPTSPKERSTDSEIAPRSLEVSVRMLED